jgi:hypothetical protein
MAVTVIVEDGSVVANANSFVSVATAESLLSDLGVEGFDEETADDKALAVVEAAKRLNHFESMLDGSRQSSSQNLLFPRLGSTLRSNKAIPSSSVPAQVLDAQALLAKEYLDLRNAPSGEEQGFWQGSSAIAMGRTREVLWVTFEDNFPRVHSLIQQVTHPGHRWQR